MLRYQRTGNQNKHRDTEPNSGVSDIIFTEAPVYAVVGAARAYSTMSQRPREQREARRGVGAYNNRAKVDKCDTLKREPRAEFTRFRSSERRRLSMSRASRFATISPHVIYTWMTSSHAGPYAPCEAARSPNSMCVPQICIRPLYR